MARAADAPVAPFGATRKGVTDLVPEARLIPGDGPLPAGQYGITEAQVDRWVDELTGAVAMRLTGWQRLNDQPVEPETDSDRDQLIAYARTLIHNGAASYVEAARHPERAEPNTTSYAGVLWDRYRTGLDELTGWLEARLAADDAGDEDAPVDTGDLAYSFPAPLFGDGLRF